jgi:excisionase family DNA binding protein
MNYLTPREASFLYNVSQETLRDWANTGKIEWCKTEGGHRRYKRIEQTTFPKVRYSVIYARVSSKKQEGDLQRQIEFIKQKCPNHKVIQDIGSGINSKRQGFRWILDQLFRRNIKEVVVSSADRFSRLGSDLFKWIFEKFDAKLIVLADEQAKTSNEELSEELLEIITVFTARYHGSRKYKISGGYEEDIDEIKDEEDTILSE